MPDDRLGPERAHFYVLGFLTFFRERTLQRAEAWGRGVPAEGERGPRLQLGAEEVCEHLSPKARALAFPRSSQPHRCVLSGGPALPGERLSISSSEVY